MKYAYTAEPVEGFTQLNPVYWEYSSPRMDAKEVIVDKAFEAVAKFYKELGADVTIKADEEPNDFTREAIDKMPKKDVADLLEAHGSEADGKVAEMRAKLKQVMFL